MLLNNRTILSFSRSVMVVVLLVCASAADAQTCQTVTVAQPSGSICTGGAVSKCSSSVASAQSAANAITAKMATITSATQQSLGTAVCTKAGGTVGPAWTNAAEVCPILPACDASQCTAATATRDEAVVSGAPRLRSDSASRKLTATGYPQLGFDTKPTYFNEKEVVFTFDDGPAYGADTLNVLNVLETYNITATFFLNSAQMVVTDWTKPNAIDAVNKMMANGHSIGSHTRTHPHLIELASNASIHSEIYDVETEMRYYFPNLPHLTLFRAPYGEPYQWNAQGDPQALPYYDNIATMVEQGFVHVGWNMDSNDAGCANDITGADCMVKNITNQLEAGTRGIILMHSTSPRTAAGLPALINYLHTNNYTIKRVEDGVKRLYGASSADIIFPPTTVATTTTAATTTAATTTAAATTAAATSAGATTAAATTAAATTAAGTTAAATTAAATTAAATTAAATTAAATTAAATTAAGTAAGVGSTLAATTLATTSAQAAATTAAATPAAPSVISTSDVVMPGSAPDATKTCCSALRTYVNQWCTGIANLDKVVVPNGDFSSIKDIPFLSGVTNCADTNCLSYGAGSTVTYSLIAMVVAALMHLVVM